MKASPKLSIGVPVYNADKYLEQAFRSLLDQTFGDFEMIVSDNASSDRTPEICQEYARQDRRIRYVRQPHNLGGGWNHNQVLNLAECEYFKWATHDDLHDPQFLERCVVALNENPKAVLAHPKTRIIDENGDFVENHNWELDTESPDVAKRFGELVLSYHHCYQIYGIIRRSVLHKTGPMGNYVHGDGVLLANLALYGPYVKIPETLFNSRRHTGQSSQTLPSRLSSRRWRLTRRTNGLPCTEWWDPRKKRKLTFPQWRQLSEYRKCVHHAPLNPWERAACYGVLGRWSARDYRRYFKDILIAGDQILDNVFAEIGQLASQRG
jgi:glycosyltransferase involved in cell wall biosynthesis